MVDFNSKPDSLLFATRQATRVGRMTSLRSVKLLCGQLGFAPPGHTLHAFRHTFAVNYLRRGGSLFHFAEAVRSQLAGDDAAVCEPCDGGLASRPRALLTTNSLARINRC